MAAHGHCLWSRTGRGRLGRGGRRPAATCGGGAAAPAGAPVAEPVLVVAGADLESARELLPGFETHILPEVQPVSAGVWPVARTLAAASIGFCSLSPPPPGLGCAVGG